MGPKAVSSVAINDPKILSAIIGQFHPQGISKGGASIGVRYIKRQTIALAPGCGSFEERRRQEVVFLTES